MKPPWEIDFYETASGSQPVRDFLLKLPKLERARVGRVIADLEWKGTALRMPTSRPLIGKENLFELRISGEQNIYRVLYFHYTGKKFVLLHAFTKKTNKTPEKEIKIALERLTDYKKGGATMAK